ncbi:hypothetical protein ACJX0J_016961, partial [Zea mays]
MGNEVAFQLDIVKTDLNKCEALFIKLDISKANWIAALLASSSSRTEIFPIRCHADMVESLPIAYLAQFIGGYAKTFQSLE